MREQEISLVELAWKVIDGWRIWLVLGVVFAVLVPAVQYMRESRTYQAALSSQTEAGVEEIAELLTEQEKIRVENVVRLQKHEETGRNYMENSILMNLDPYKVDVLVLTYSIKGSKNALVLANALTSYVSSEMDKVQIWDGILEEQNPEYIDELFSAYSSGDNGTRAKTVGVTAYGRNQEDLEKIESRVQDAMETKIKELRQEEPGAQITLISKGRKTTVDSGLCDLQQTMQEKCDVDTRKITELTTNFTDQQKEYMDVLGKTDAKAADGQSSNEQSANQGQTADGQAAGAGNTAAAPGISKKYILLGGFLGVFLGMCCIACVYIFSGRLRDAEELAGGFGLRQYGVITRDGTKKGIDAFLEQLRNRKKVTVPEPEAWDLAAGNVRLYCKTNEIKHLFITGTELSKLEESARRTLKEKLSEKDIQVSFGGSVTYDKEALDQAAGCDGVLLIEMVGESRYTELEKELQTLQNQNMSIIGCITVA